MGDSGEQDQRGPGPDRRDEGRGPQGQPEAGKLTPRTVADVDATIADHLRDYHRGRWIAAAAAIAVLAATVIVLAILYLQQDTRLKASCQFWRLLAPLPVTIVPPAQRPTRLSIVLITDTREAYAGQGCGVLPPADPSVLKWGPYYHIRVP